MLTWRNQKTSNLTWTIPSNSGLRWRSLRQWPCWVLLGYSLPHLRTKVHFTLWAPKFSSMVSFSYSRLALSRNEEQKCKPFNTEGLESGKWKKINIQKPLPRIRSVKYFKCEILGKTVYLNLQSFVWKRHVGVPFWNTNMAAGYQQKHLFSSFRTNAWILRLRNS